MGFRVLCVLLALVLSLVGCGGGGGSGGGSGSPPPAQEPPAEEPPAEEPPAEEPPAEEPPDEEPPEPPQAGSSSASIVFPWQKASATASTLTVRGIASDPDGVVRVLVNNVEVPLEVLSPLAAPTAAPALAMGKPVAVSGSSAAQNEDVPEAEVVAWSAVIELEQGTNDVTVDVVDGSGEIEEGVASSTVQYTEVPVPFEFDPARLRLVGPSFTLRPDGYGTRLAVHQYDIGEQTVYPQSFPAAAASCLRGDVDVFYYLVRPTDAYVLRQFDLVGLNDAEVTTIPSGLLDPGAGFEPEPHIQMMVCGAGDALLYLLVNFTATGGGDFAKSRILAIDTASGAAETLVETNPAESPPWIARKMALTGDELVTLEDLNPVGPLVRVDLTDGARTTLSPDLDVGGLAVMPALDEGIVYVATFDGIDEIDLTQAPPVRRNVSVVGNDDPFVFSQIRSAALDEANRRVLVGDEELDMIIAVDVDTGERSDLVSRSIGEGVRLIAPRRIALTQAADKAYVLDDGSNAPERLFEIDLATGDRRVVGNIVRQFNVFATGLALDETGGQVYVAFPDTILRVDIATEAVTAVASDATGLNFLRGASDLIFDAANQRLLVTDAVLDAIIAVDVLTREQVVLSKAGTVGEGPALEGVTSLVLTDSEALYVTNQLSGTIARVSPSTGDREIVLAQCLDESSNNVLGLNQILQQIHYDQATDELLILGDNLLAFDPATSACRILHPFLASRDVIRLQLTPQNQLLALTFGALVQLDTKTWEVAILSR